MSNVISVLGAGSWGTTLAIHLSKKGNSVKLWEFLPDVAKQLDEVRENKDFLPGIAIPENILITSDLMSVVKNTDIVVFAVPSHVVREVAYNFNKTDYGTPIIVNVAKGIENDTLLRMSEVLEEELPGRLHDKICTLSGPSHAEEVSRNMPTTIVAASRFKDIAKQVQEVFMSEYLRVYTNTDIIGVELAGSLKNIIAIATGITDGLGYGDNAKGALLTRGLAEITRLGVKMGANPLTFAGLSGMGDLITTCMSQHSRNRYVGEKIGKGQTLKEVLANMKMVAEGVRTTKSAYQLAQNMKIEMPITEQMYDILFNDKNPQSATRELMLRDPKSEIEEF